MFKFAHLLIVISQLAVSFLFSQSQTVSEFPSEYGVDVSFPIHHYIDKSKHTHFAAAYQHFIEGCYKDASKRECDINEKTRLEMNLEQPAKQHNYTEVGFKKLTVPKFAWDPLLHFYQTNVHNEKPERWPKGSIYVNHWVSTPSMISLEDSSLRGGLQLKQLIWNAVKPIIEEWVGREVEPTSLYGIRVYKNQSILATHVDRLPLVSSAIIQVAQDVDEPWPIEVFDHAGMAHNITMQPGDLVLYESHTVLHGRPFPMKGRYYANVFVHFKPLDHEMMNKADEQQAQAVKKDASLLSKLFGTSNNKLPRSEEKDVGGHEQSNLDPVKVDEMRKRFSAFDTNVELEVRRETEHKRDELANGILDGKQRNKGEKTGVIHHHDEDHESSEAEHEEELSQEEALLGSTGPAPAEEEEQQEQQLEDPEQAAWNELMQAAMDEDMATVQYLVSSQPELLMRSDENKWTVLHEAVRSGSEPMVRFLLEQGADPLAQVNEGVNALELADTLLPSDHPVIELLKEHIELREQQ